MNYSQTETVYELWAVPVAFSTALAYDLAERVRVLCAWRTLGTWRRSDLESDVRVVAVVLIWKSQTVSSGTHATQ